MRRLLISATIIATVLLSACASSGPEHRPDSGVLTPMPEARVEDPDDSVMAAAIQEYLRQEGKPAVSQYEYARIDLDGDGRRDSLVLFVSPHMTWCNINGCQMAVFKASNTHFTLLSEIEPVRGPLLVSETRTNGFQDLILRISGRMDSRAKDVVLRYDGYGYPGRPDVQPPLPLEYAYSDIQGVRVFP